MKIGASDWRLLLGALAIQIVAAVLVRIVRVDALPACAARLRRIARFLLHGPEARVVWAVEATGRRLGPFGTCLIRAIVTELALGDEERPLTVKIGVRRTEDGQLEAHAWLARENEIVMGEASGEFVPFMTWQSVFV
jgi:hypothetical protein